MSTLRETYKGRKKIIIALAEFDYLIVSQLTRLFYAPSSRAFVQKELNAAVDGKFAVAITPRSVTRHGSIPSPRKGTALLPCWEQRWANGSGQLKNR